MARLLQAGGYGDSCGNIPDGFLSIFYKFNGGLLPNNLGVE
jgi:hypothetical protein